MSAEIIIFNNDVITQRALLNAFASAANVLDELDINALKNLKSFDDHKMIKDLIGIIVDYVPVEQSLKENFENATCALFFKMIPNFEFIESDDKEAIQEVIYSQKLDLERRFKNIAVNHGLLPQMFEKRYGS